MACFGGDEQTLEANLSLQSYALTPGYGVGRRSTKTEAFDGNTVPGDDFGKTPPFYELPAFAMYPQEHAGFLSIESLLVISVEFARNRHSLDVIDRDIYLA